jgi:hypothetical protein
VPPVRQAVVAPVVLLHAHETRIPGEALQIRDISGFGRLGRDVDIDRQPAQAVQQEHHGSAALEDEGQARFGQEAEQLKGVDALFQ